LFQKNHLNLKKNIIIMAERPEDLNLPITVVQRLIKEAVI
jgi:hypothetical protein